MLAKILEWWRWQMLTPEEKYLMKAANLADLERRQKEIWSFNKTLKTR